MQPADQELGGGGFNFDQNEQNLGGPNPFNQEDPDPFRPIEEQEEFQPPSNPNPLSAPKAGGLGAGGLGQPIALPANFVKPPPGKEENSEVLKWKNINMIVVAVTTFITIIFLQVLA